MSMLSFFVLIFTGCPRHIAEATIAEVQITSELNCGLFLEDLQWYSGPGEDAWFDSPPRFGVMVDTRACGPEQYEAYLLINQRFERMESTWVMYDERLPSGAYTTYDVTEYTFGFDHPPANLEFTVVVKEGPTVLSSRDFWIDCINDRDDGLCHADMMPEAISKRW